MSDKQSVSPPPEYSREFAGLMPMGTTKARRVKRPDVETIFKLFYGGVKTNRDTIAYDFDKDSLVARVQQFVTQYSTIANRYKESGQSTEVDAFLKQEQVKWSAPQKKHLKNGVVADFQDVNIRTAMYRPFAKRFMFFDPILIDRHHQFNQILPTPDSEQENRVIWLKTGPAWPMFALMTNSIVDSLPQGGSQCFPYYAYEEGGKIRRENITDWALGQFRTHYDDKSINKWDVFYYVYGLLHHPQYRQRYAEVLKRELPRIPFAPEFRAFADAGKKLADLHLNYEEVSPHRFQWIMDGSQGISYLVRHMLLQDQISAGEGKPYVVYDALVVNRLLTLIGIPPEAFDYRLGNLSALEWVIDQYRVRKDKHSGIHFDPNKYAAYRDKGERYIIRLVGQVVAVSLETVKIVNALAEQPMRPPEVSS